MFCIGVLGIYNYAIYSVLQSQLLAIVLLMVPSVHSPFTKKHFQACSCGHSFPSSNILVRIFKRSLGIRPAI